MTVHLLNSYSRHLVICSYGAVYNLNLMENRFGKIKRPYDDHSRIFLSASLPRCLVHQPVCPWPETDLHQLPPFHSTALTLVPATTISPWVAISRKGWISFCGVVFGDYFMVLGYKSGCHKEDGLKCIFSIS